MGDDSGVHAVVASLSDVHPDAGRALAVIARFDALVESRAGLEPVLALVAALTDTPARILVPELGIDLRCDVDGTVERGARAPDPRWLHQPLPVGASAALWLERAGPPSIIDGMVLDRAAFASREILHRTRTGLGSFADDPAAVEVLLDANASEGDRLHAAAVLRLAPAAPVRAVARSGAAPRIERADARSPERGDRRTGVGPAVPLLELPHSWEQARLALRFAAAGTEQDPGPTVVYAEELGALVLLAGGLDCGTRPVPDVLAVERAGRIAPWGLATLDAVVSHASVRLAAAALFVHHSTLQTRVAALENALGWSVHDQQGRLRVQLALACRRLLLHPPEAKPVSPFSGGL